MASRSFASRVATGSTSRQNCSNTSSADSPGRHRDIARRWHHGPSLGSGDFEKSVEGRPVACYVEQLGAAANLEAFEARYLGNETVQSS